MGHTCRVHFFFINTYSLYQTLYSIVIFQTYIPCMYFGHEGRTSNLFFKHIAMSDKLANVNYLASFFF